MGNCISGICCRVKECKFHDGESECVAGEIDVGGTSAYTAVVGDCAHVATCVTFQPKN